MLHTLFGTQRLNTVQPFISLRKKEALLTTAFQSCLLKNFKITSWIGSCHKNVMTTRYITLSTRTSSVMKMSEV